MHNRSAEGERRRGIVWIAVGVAVTALMFGAWWLVATTNREGQHDAELLPILASIPLLIGAYHLLRSRYLHRHD